jgi:Zn-dependent protease with chaperone function
MSIATFGYGSAALSPSSFGYGVVSLGAFPGSALTVQTITTSGITPALVFADALGNQFVNNGRTMLLVENIGGAPITVTVVSQVACNQGVTHSPTLTVADGATVEAGPWSPARFSDSRGYVQLEYSSVTGVTVGVFSL